MKLSRCSWSVLFLSFACSSEPSTDGTVNSGSTSDTSGSTPAPMTTTGTSSTTTASAPTGTSTAPTTTNTGATGATTTTGATGTSTGGGTGTTSGSGGSGTSSAPSSTYDDSESTPGNTSEYESQSTSADESSDSEATSSAGETSDEQPGECVKGSTKGNEVLMIGESFIAASHGITRKIEELARANGSLAQGETYGDRSVPGTRLTGGIDPTITNQYVEFQGRDNVRFVLMDGGGNDCLQASGQQPASALGAAEALFEEMASSGVEKIVYFFYPDPLPPIGNDQLKSCLDTMRPQMKALCDGLTSPSCHWLDLRDTWNGHPEYTDDGIHPTAAGDAATGEAIWEAMVENCVAQ